MIIFKSSINFAMFVTVLFACGLLAGVTIGKRHSALNVIIEECSDTTKKPAWGYLVLL